MGGEELSQLGVGKDGVVRKLSTAVKRSVQQCGTLHQQCGTVHQQCPYLVTRCIIYIYTQ